MDVVLQCVAVCYSVLHCVVLRFVVLKRVACCGVLQCVVLWFVVLKRVACCVLQCVAVCCSVLCYGLLF